MNGEMSSLLEFLDASPSPYHAVASAVADLEAAGFVAVDERQPLSVAPVGALRAGYLVRRGALIAWRLPDEAPSHVRIVGAHTDSPGFRVTPRPEQRLANWTTLGVEIYGGVLLNSWLDRDLGVAGEVTLADGTRRLFDSGDAVARIAQLAIHLDREVNDGLRLDRHQHTRPIWATSPAAAFGDWLADHVGAPVIEWDLALYDVQRAAVIGADRSLIASGRLDNQLSCWAAIRGLIAAESDADVGHAAVVALFDHEEVGSSSRTGAAGPLLADVLDRLLDCRGVSGADSRSALFARSSCVSADNAHAIHPNYPERHDGDHAPLVNGGPAIKHNVNQRYATDAETAALFVRCCEAAGVPWQRFVSRNNIPCGSTIGPLTATRLGIATVDVGVPQLSMHSARELCGADDAGHLSAALCTYLSAAE